ncbi:RNA polymerase sigma factor [Streptomyces sp. CMB-StM0423]|uniref:RNA polymerase sigma factor n=1 Tax=Streptomyces sp. CMB-StM0423 TaxID=2059884 RepID=UPI001F17DDCC|nr:sigma-70 family RNA polymerase sigma factor [Streptomyces sp. CMB-StM0423]
MAVRRRPAHGGPGRRGADHAHSADTALSAADARRVRAVLALGGVPFGELDDGVQQVQLKLLEQHLDPDRAPVRNPAAWAAAVASRVAADWHRGRTRDAGLRDRLAARWTRPAEHPEDARLLALAVAEGLEELPPGQRQVIVLRYYADLPVKDIAEAMGIPEGTVKSRLHGAAAVLRTRLREREVG